MQALSPGGLSTMSARQVSFLTKDHRASHVELENQSLYFIQLNFRRPYQAHWLMKNILLPTNGFKPLVCMSFC